MSRVRLHRPFALTTAVVLAGAMMMPTPAAAAEVSAAGDPCAVTPLPAPTPPTPPSGRDKAWAFIHGAITGIGKAAATVKDPTTAPDLAGWFLDVTTTTKKSDPQYDKISQALSQQQDQMDQLQTTLSYVCTTTAQTQQELQQVASHDIWTAFQSKTGQIETVVGNIKADTNKLGLVMSAVAGAPGAPLTDPQLGQYLTDVRSDTIGNMEKLNTYVVGTPGAKDSLAELYGSVIEDTLSHSNPARPVPSSTGIYYNEYLDPLYDQINYVAGLMTTNIQLLAEAYHAAFVNGSGQQVGSDPGTVTTEAGTANQYVNNWVATAAPTNGNIPEGTFVDTRAGTNLATMWSANPVSINGQPPASYCYQQTTFCFANLYDTGGQIGDTKLVPGVRGDLPTLGGLTDWRVPTQADYTGLAKGAAGGLGPWFAHIGVTALAGTTVTSHAGGSDTQIDSVGPLLTVNSSGQPGVMHWAAPAANPASGSSVFTFTAPTESQSQPAGLLFLVRNYPINSQADRTPAATTKVTIGQAVPVRGSVPAAALGTGQVFTAATECASGTTYTVPAGANVVKIVAVGGRGGSSNVHGKSTTNTWITGGTAGQVTDYIPVQPGAVLHIQVAGTGGDTQGAAGGGGTGGASVNGYSGNHSGGGGGASGVSADAGCSQWLAVAAGGGGAGAAWASTGGFGPYNGGRGGNACPSLSTPCDHPDSGTDGYNGAPSMGGGDHGSPPPHNVGAGGKLTAWSGSTMHGGNGSDGSRDKNGFVGGGAGGGGGAGYFGGGGGGGGGTQAGGGGGAGGANFAIDADGNNTAQSVVVGDVLTLPYVVLTPLATIVPSLALAASTSSSGFGAPITLTSRMPADATGNITFYDFNQTGTDKSIGVAPIVNGVAQLSSFTKTLDIGSHTFSASFAGSQDYDAVDSNQVTYVVDKRPPAVTLTASNFRLQSTTDPLALTATISPLAATGNMDFYSRDSTGTTTFMGRTPIVNGVATFRSTQFLQPLHAGNNELDAYYWADGSHLGDQFDDAESAWITVAVNGLSGPARTTPNTVGAAPEPPDLANTGTHALLPIVLIGASFVLLGAILTRRSRRRGRDRKSATITS